MIDGLVSHLGSILLNWFKDHSPMEGKPASESPTSVTKTATSKFDPKTEEPLPQAGHRIPPMWQNRNNARRPLQAGDRVHLEISSGDKSIQLSHCVVVGSSQGDYHSVQSAYGTYYLVADASGQYYEVARSELKRPHTEGNSWWYQPTLPQIMAPYLGQTTRAWVPVRTTSGNDFHQERIPSPFYPGEKVYFPTAYLKNGPVAKNQEVYTLVEFPKHLHRDAFGDIYLEVKEEHRDSYGKSYTSVRKVPLSALRGESDRPRTLWNKIHTAV